MHIGKYEFPDDLLYDDRHCWARVEGNVLTQGFTDFGQALANEIMYVEVPRVGRTVKRGEPFMSLESGKWVGRVYALVSGTILQANGSLEDEPTLINTSPYGDGWFARFQIADPAELASLWRPADPAFQAFIAAERKKYGL